MTQSDPYQDPICNINIFRPYLCPECGKSLSTNENLKRHLIRHTGIKPYSCNLCPSRFVFKSGLTSHMSTHSGLKPFICATCGSSFTKSSSLTKHHRIHTGCSLVTSISHSLEQTFNAGFFKKYF